MKLLLDQNISRKLVEQLADIFPGTSHVSLLGLQTATDQEIWEFAKKNDFVIVTQDSDFNERSVLYGYPPKVVWLRIGNTSTRHMNQVLRDHAQIILDLEEDKIMGCLEIF